MKSVVLNTLNRARFTVAVESFIKTGRSSQSSDMHIDSNKLYWAYYSSVVLARAIANLYSPALHALRYKSFLPYQKGKHIIDMALYNTTLNILIWQQLFYQVLGVAGSFGFSYACLITLWVLWEWIAHRGKGGWSRCPSSVSDGIISLCIRVKKKKNLSY